MSKDKLALQLGGYHMSALVLEKELPGKRSPKYMTTHIF